MTGETTSATTDASEPLRQGPASSYIAATRAELSKLTSLPAIWLTLAGTLALTVLLSLLFVRQAEFTRTAHPTAHAAGVLDFGVAALGWSQIGFFLLGVISATSEYVGGQIRTTLIAIPRRGIQRLAANSALALLTYSAALATVLISVTTVVVASGTDIDELDGYALARIVFSAAGYLVCMTILSASMGLLIRRTIPAAAALLVYLLLVSPLLQGQHWYFLPDIASYALWYATVPPGAPPAVVCWLVIIIWTAAALIPATIMFIAHDTSPAGTMASRLRAAARQMRAVPRQVKSRGVV